MNNELETLRPEVKDPNLLATSPTKWRAEHCVTHHHACDCREWEHATRVAELEDRAERAEAELAALKARIAEAPVATLVLASSAGDLMLIWAENPDEWVGKDVRLVVDEPPAKDNDNA